MESIVPRIEKKKKIDDLKKLKKNEERVHCKVQEMCEYLDNFHLNVSLIF